MNRRLSPREFVIAGLLNEGPSHGYEVEKKIESRGMRNWTQIGFSSIYHILGILKKAGYVTKSSRVAAGKLQQVYELTPEGKDALNEQIIESITTIHRGGGDFDVAIANTVEMSSDEIQTLLQQRILNLEEHVSELEQLRDERINSGMPNIPATTILFDRPIALLKAECDFLQTYIQRF